MGHVERADGDNGIKGVGIGKDQDERFWQSDLSYLLNEMKE